MCTITTTFYMVLMFAYVTLRYARFLAVIPGIKIGLTVLLALGVLHLPILLAMKKYGFSCAVCENVLAFLHILLVMLFFAAIVLDVMKLLKVSVPAVLPFAVLAVCACLSVYGVFQARKIPQVRTVTVVSSSLPEMKIVQLTDLHLGLARGKEWLSKTVEKANALQPDLIVITGDSVDGMPEKIGAELEALKELKASLGIYIIPGNHEHYYNVDAWNKAFTQMGLRILQNTHETVGGIVLGGADWKEITKQAPSNLDETFKGSDPSLPRVLLSHYPAVFDEAVKRNVVLQLSGHTHGGSFFPVSLLIQAHNGGHLSGLNKQDGSFLYTSPGTALWDGFPVRIGTANEITLIRLAGK